MCFSFVSYEKKLPLRRLKALLSEELQHEFSEKVKRCLKGKNISVTACVTPLSKTTESVFFYSRVVLLPGVKGCCWKVSGTTEHLRS